MLKHKQTFHKEAQDSQMALPVVDMKQPGISQKLSSLGIRHCLVLANSSGGLFGLPTIPSDIARNPAVCNLGALGVSKILSLGPAKALLSSLGDTALDLEAQKLSYGSGVEQWLDVGIIRTSAPLIFGMKLCWECLLYLEASHHSPHFVP
ncbi:hypothetical protein J6590_074207 [Homalodisca vitripennis]|nr:hypothetical protein J6590_074207 [Homalodisca vitripennis]